MPHHPVVPGGLCQVAWLGGGVKYAAAMELQSRLVAQRTEGHAPNTLLLLEHAPVYTAGRRSPREHVLGELPVPLVHTDRGGQITYHGPGQLVGYPILQLASLGMGPRQYVRALEQILISTVGEFGIMADRLESLTGVWAEGAKLAAIGVRIKHGVSMHGFALNVAPVLDYFQHIIPCGVMDRSVTSMQSLLGHGLPVEAVREAVVRYFGMQFNLRIATANLSLS